MLSKAVLFAPGPDGPRAQFPPFYVRVLRAQRSDPLSRQSRLLWLVHGKRAEIRVFLGVAETIVG